jgi:hypothetical protein
MEKILGKHPNKKGIGQWLNCTDHKKNGKVHRELYEKEGTRDKAIEMISDWLIKHHISEKKQLRLKKMYSKYGYDKIYKNLKPFPTSDKTQKGNCTEIILAEYLVQVTNLKLLVFKLRYNPNIDQSMKGDDVLLLNPNKLNEKIIVGEAKFRKTPSKAVLDEIVESFESNNYMPISLSFIAEIVSNEGNDELSEAIEELQAQLYKMNTPVLNIGFLLSNHNAANNVNRYEKKSGSNLIFISLGTTDCEKIITDSYKKSFEKLKL